MSDVGALGLLFAISSLTIMITFIALGGLYLLFSYGLYRLADRAGVQNSWLAFIPFVQYYTMGKVIKEVRICNFVIPHLEWVLLLAPVVYAILAQIPFANILAGVACFLFYVIVTYHLFKKYSQNAVLMTVIGLLLPFMYAVFVFAIRNNAPLKVKTP
ncbi:MAG: hypothetical protein ACOY3U_07160 [Bacillota bacterium]